MAFGTSEDIQRRHEARMERKRLEEAQQRSANDAGGLPRQPGDDTDNPDDPNEEINAVASIEEHEDAFKGALGDIHCTSTPPARKKRRLEAPKDQRMGPISQAAKESLKKMGTQNSGHTLEGANDMSEQPQPTARDEQPSSDFIDPIGEWEEARARRRLPAGDSVARAAYASTSVDLERHNRHHDSMEAPRSPFSPTRVNSGAVGTASSASGDLRAPQAG